MDGVNYQEAAAVTEQARAAQRAGKLAEAVALFRRAAALAPGLAVAQHNLGVVLCQSGFLEEGFAAWRRHAELVSAAGGAAGQIGLEREQAAYRRRIGLPGDGFYIGEAGRVTGRAVNRDACENSLRWGHKASKSIASPALAEPRIAVVDNFLSDEALARLRQFCLTSSIWRNAYAPGYIGALPEHGLGSPLLAQICEELREAYPAMIGAHALRQFWGFIYDSRREGIGIHADAAAVNVNFWITPDEANLDAASGGLVLWDAPAPEDWDFARYNDDVGAAQDFLAAVGARRIVLPYRANRAVIFDSRLFHATDRIAFREGLESRRVNLTLLFGERG